jgi:ADP-dependent NAD(P)H-hydrate dehydratase
VSDLDPVLASHPFPAARGTKDDRGTLVVIGGEAACPGAVLLAGTAALRTGTGRVQLVVHPDVAAAVAVARPEALVLGWDQRRPAPFEVRRALAGAGAVIIGPGQHEQHRDALLEVAAHTGERPLVLDAAALEHASSLGDNVVVAPNEAEAFGMLGVVVAAPAPALAALLDRAVAVRGPRTVLAEPCGRCWAVDDGPDGLGTPGSGDVLAGVLGGLLSRGMVALGALAWAVVLHAAAGARLAGERPVGFLAGELADALPFALQDLSRRRG